jgi:23S rRNA pseudouridine1911/1915/1917 synthase
MNSLKSSSSDSASSGLYRFVVQPQDAGTRLDKLLGEHPRISSREMARRLIDHGAVRLNEKTEAPSTRVRAEDVVEFAVPPPEPLDTPAQEGPLDILYEDDALIVLNKPAGVPMHPGPGHAQGTLVNFLLHHCPNLSGIGGRRRPGIVHRLDKDTSGVVVAAKHDRAHIGLAEQFKAHTVTRSYVAVVVGSPPRAAGKVNLPIGRHPKNRLKRMVRSNGKEAVTHWKVETRFPNFTLLRLRLETGRTHQIRVHMADQGWPVLGDPLYGGGRHHGLELEEPLRTVLRGFRRQALHAVELGFVHPGTGTPLHFVSPLPDDMRALLETIAARQPERGEKGTAGG